MITKLTKFLIDSKIEGEKNEIPGAYLLKTKRYGKLLIIVGIGEDWEHVSVSRRLNQGKSKIPTWEIMCYVKDLFFKPNETVIQFHPKKSNYVNMHPNVLHLWKNCNYEHELPPSMLV